MCVGEWELRGVWRGEKEMGVGRIVWGSRIILVFF